MKKDDIFIVSELFGKDCLAFFKVLTVINRVLDIAQEGHLLPGLPQQLRAKSTKATSHSSQSGKIRATHEIPNAAQRFDAK
ncbi:hypothetical protein FJTKL_04464 [Diaporthe vaccinii]|uniref:Cdc24/Scd1 N-terminal domain-containing protein n=1 Tax=Diaporthe vaccinii TaxID=105482 RepID=A0ABR4DSZ0_9PEZI